MKGDRTGRSRKAVTDKKRDREPGKQMCKGEATLEPERNSEVEKALLKTDRVHESEIIKYEVFSLCRLPI